MEQKIRRGNFRRDTRPEGPVINERVLRFRDVRVIGAEGEQIGILQPRQALNMAREQGLDLVLVAGNADPPVCRILDYGKFKYLSEKQKKESKSVKQDIKGIKISPRIAEHDIQTALDKAIKFLGQGHKVRVVCQFRAREAARPELGLAKLKKMSEKIQEIATVEREPQMEGRLMVMVLLPKAGAKKKDVKTEDAQDGGKEVQGDGIGEDHAPEVG